MPCLVLNEIVVRAINDRREAREKLETCDKNRDIAVMQGNIQGWSFLLGQIAEEFHSYEFSPAFYNIIEDNEDRPSDFSKLDAISLSALHEAVIEIGKDERWQKIQKAIASEIEGLKGFLLFRAAQSRDLDVSQGKYRAMVCYESVFENIKSEVEWREEERKRLEKQRSESLDFGDGPAGEPGIPSAELKAMDAKAQEAAEAVEEDEALDSIDGIGGEEEAFAESELEHA